MEKRITRQILEYISNKIKKNKQFNLIKARQEVNIGANGTHRYMIKEGKNKGKVL